MPLNIANAINDLSVIAKQYGIVEFIKVEQGDKLCKANGEYNYINKSYMCGKDRIELGIYDNIEYLIASFFHEIGHILETVNNQYNSEEKAWEIGFKLAKLAKLYGYELSNGTHNWAVDQLKTYNIENE